MTGSSGGGQAGKPLGDDEVARARRRDVFHRHAMAAWRAYQATGLHVCADEADAWLAELESNRVTDPPVAHW